MAPIKILNFISSKSDLGYIFQYAIIDKTEQLLFEVQCRHTI